jgi:molybdenum cofactor synthesis domain-containing protein
MSETSPLVEAQQKFADTVPFRTTGAEDCRLEDALGRVLHDDIIAPTDMPPYHRAIVEGFLVHTADTQGASETAPQRFEVVGQVKPGDSRCPGCGRGEALEVATGSIVTDGDFSIVRMWEAHREGDTFTITRPFPPRFFIEEQGCDIRKDATVLAMGSRLQAADIGNIASLGIANVRAARRPKVTIFASGDEVIPFTDALRPGAIRDSNSPMLAAAVREAGGIPAVAGIMRDDFDRFAAALREALKSSDMVVISGGTAVGGRDFISDLVRAMGELIVDGVPMRSGRPLIMGSAQGKPLVCVAGHPPEALRGFRLFGVAALNRLLGHTAELPQDN